MYWKIFGSLRPLSALKCEEISEHIHSAVLQILSFFNFFHKKVKNYDNDKLFFKLDQFSSNKFCFWKFFHILRIFEIIYIYNAL